VIKVLQLTYRVPFPPTDGGAIGIYNITKGLKENNCEIDLVAINTPKHQQPKDAMKAFANQYDVFVDTTIHTHKLFKNLLFSKLPYNIERFLDPKVEELLISLLKNNQYDFIQIEGAFVAYYIDLIKQITNSPILIRTHNIEFVIWERLAVNEKNVFKKWYYNHLAKRLYKFESHYYNKASAIAAITQEDKHRLEKMGVSIPIEIIPAGVVIDKYLNNSTQPINLNSIFSISALDWLPNLEGLEWFLKNIWPKVLNQNPTCEFHIAGKSTPDWLLKRNYPNVKVHGFVEDATQFKNNYNIMVVPLLSGGGMRVKIVEGMAARKCIISTKIGAEGIQVIHEKDIYIADSIDEWVETLIELLNNQEKVDLIRDNALNNIKLNYENKQITQRYIDLYLSVKSDA
jgi:glycosyltransferase involved in cell wall biosynthesis